MTGHQGVTATVAALTPNQWAIYDRVTTAAVDLRGQLRELVQIAHLSAHPGDVTAVQNALFRAHGYQRDGHR